MILNYNKLEDQSWKEEPSVISNFLVIFISHQKGERSQ